MSVDDRLVELLVRWEESLEDGAELTAQELCPDDEHLRADLQKWIEDHRRLQTPAHAPERRRQRMAPTPVDLSFLAPPLASDELGRLGNYRVLKVLGSGGMGIVL